MPNKFNCWEYNSTYNIQLAKLTEMSGFQLQMDKLIRSFHNLTQTNRNLYQMAELKIINRQLLYQNPFINDELVFWKIQLEEQRKIIEENCEIIRTVIGRLIEVGNADIHGSQLNLLGRVVMRTIELVEGTKIEMQNEYYEEQNKKFKKQCGDMIQQMAKLQPFEVVKILYKYLRHFALVQLERYQEILDCITQTDFASLARFKKDFYAILQKTQARKKLPKPQKHGFSIPISHKKQQAQQEQTSILRNQHHSVELPEHSKQKTQVNTGEPPQKSENKKDIQSHDKKQAIQKKQNVNIKIKFKNNSAKKLGVLFDTVIQTKKDQASPKDEKQIYYNLMNRNKVNQSQISTYFNYSQHMNEHINRVKTEDFYYYAIDKNQESAQEIHKSPQPTITKEASPIRKQKQSMFASLQPSRKDITLLTNNAPRNKQNKTIHRSIDCKVKNSPQNVEVKEAYEHKPIKINSQFFDLNLRTIIPPRRQSNFDKMVVRASSMGVIKQDLQSRRIQVTNQNGKTIEDGVFKSVKILHHNPFDAQKHAKFQRELKEKIHQPSIRHEKIESRIKQELQHGEHLEGRYHEGINKIWGDHLVLKKLQII